MAPGLILVALFVVPPVLAVFGLSLFRVELLRDDLRPFVGLRNYLVRLPIDTEFLWTIPRTFVFALVATVVAVPVALAAAAFVNRGGRGAGAMSLLILLPWAVAPIAAGLFWAILFNANSGLANDALTALGLPTVRLLGAPGALLATLLAVVWRAIPLLGLLFLGALRSVPKDIVRAARLDGASALQTLRHVTLPFVAPTVTAACLLQVILTLQVFDVQFALSADHPPPGAGLTALAIFDTIINDLSLGYGAAETVLLGLVIAACVGALLLVLRPRRPGARGTEEPAQDRQGGTYPVAGRRQVTPVLAAQGGPFERDAIEAAPSAASTQFRRSAGRALAKVAVVAAGAVLVAWFVIPIGWILIASVQPESALRAVPPALQLQPNLDGYQRLLDNPAWRNALVVSVEVTLGASALALLVATLTAYPLARFRFAGRRLLMALLLATQLVPPIALSIPILLTFVAVGLRNTVVGLILVNAAFWTPILVWLVRAAFLAVPASLEAAARMDGSSRLGAILRISLPSAAPSIAAAMVIVMIGIWNDFVFAATLGGRATQTLPRWLGESPSPALHILAAAIVLTIAPCLVLVALLHRRILAAV